MHPVRLSSKVAPSKKPVPAHFDALNVEPVMKEMPGDDGMTVKVFRLDAEQQIAVPAIEGNVGNAVIAVNGSLCHADDWLEPWSLIWVGHTGIAPVFAAGAEGMVAVFPVRENWMQTMAAA